MPLFDFTGNATVTTLDAPISDIDLTLTLTSPSGWPDGSDGDWTMTLDRGKDGLEEKLRCGARVGGDVTILQRGYDDTSPVAHSLPSTAEHTINAVWAKDTSKHIYNTARDDHTQYMKADGVRHDVTARHLFGTSIPTGVPSSVGTALTEGVSTSGARLDHGHDVGANAVTAGTIAAGAITELADFVDAVKPSFVDETAPASPFIGQRWVQPSTLSLSMWDGSEWVEIASGLPSVLDESGLSLTPSNTTYALGAPNIVGVAFTAPRSGIVRVDFAARMQHDFNLLFVCPRIRTGATVGSGTNVFSPNDDDAILLRNGTVRTGSFITPGGLTPGGSYNAALEHRVNAGTALELSARKIMVTPHKKGS